MMILELHDAVRLQDDIVALQSPGGGGWRQLDDAHSKMYDGGYFYLFNNRMSTATSISSVRPPLISSSSYFICMPFWHNFSTGISSWSAPNSVSSSSADSLSPATIHR